MKLLKLLLFVLLTPLLVAGQNILIDSLEALLRKHPVQDTSYVKILSELSFELRGDDIPRAHALGHRSLRLARKLNYRDAEIFALASLAHSSIRAGIGDSARTYGQEAVILAQNNSNLYVKGISLFTLGFVYFRQGEYIKSVTLLEQAVATSKSSGNAKVEVLALQVLGRNYENLGDYSRSLGYAMKSLEVLKQVNYPAAVSLSLSTIGTSYLLVSDFKQAMDYHMQALQQAKIAGSKRALSFVLESLGDTYRLQNNYLKAIETYKDALQLNEKTHDVSNQLILKVSMAEVYELLKNYALAFRYASAALKGAIDLPEKTRAQIILARAHLHTNRSDSALYYALEGLLTAQRIGRKAFSRDASQILSEANFQQKKFAEAYKYQSLYINYKDSIATDQTARRVALLQYQADLDKSRSQIKLLSARPPLENVDTSHGV